MHGCKNFGETHCFCLQNHIFFRLFPHITVFWIVTSPTLLEGVKRCFGLIYCFHLHCFNCTFEMVTANPTYVLMHMYRTAWHNVSEDLDLIVIVCLRNYRGTRRTNWLWILMFTESYLSLGGAFGWSTALQARRSRVRFPIMSMEILIDVILPAALWLWGWLSL